MSNKELNMDPTVAEDCKVSDADPVPQWQKCVDAVVETMNRTAAASAPAVPHPPEQAGGVLTQHCLDGHHGACTNPFCGCECHVPAEAPRPAATQEMTQVEELIRLWRRRSRDWPSPDFSRAADELEYFVRVRRAAVQPSAAPQKLTHRLNLMAIRKWVDEGFARWSPRAAAPAPNGYAGEAAAAVWSHVQAIAKDYEAAVPPSAALPVEWKARIEALPRYTGHDIVDGACGDPAYAAVPAETVFVRWDDLADAPETPHRD